jgi:hypothetical protein
MLRVAMPMAASNETTESATRANGPRSRVVVERRTEVVGRVIVGSSFSEAHPLARIDTAKMMVKNERINLFG